MATLDKVRIQYETDFNDATKELGKFNKEQQKVDNQAKKNQKTFESNAQKRERILKEETQDLKELEKRSKAAFNPGTIQDYNKRINETKGRISALRGETDKAGKSQSSFNNLLLKGAGLLAGAFAVERLITFGKSLFTTAQQMEAFQRRASVVFGQASKDVEAFARSNALSLGFTASEFIGAAAAVGDILVPLGFARDRAAEMSTEALRLGSALKEFTGDQREASDIANIVAKAFTGEVESLKGLGIVINQNDQQFKDLVKSKIRDEGATAQQAKALAIYETVLSSATDALTSYEENTDTLSRKTAELSANTRELAEEMSKALTPAFAGVTEELLEIVKIGRSDDFNIFQKLAGFIDPLSRDLLTLEMNLTGVKSQLDEVFNSTGKVTEEVEENVKIFKEYGNTIVGLKEKVKDYKLQLEGLELDTDEFTIKQKQLTDAQIELATALGKTTKAVKAQTDAFKERLRIIQEEGRVRAQLLSAEEQEAKEAEELATRISQDALDRDDEFFDAELEKSIEANEALADEQFIADIKAREQAEVQRLAMIQIKRAETDAIIGLVANTGALLINLEGAFGSKNAQQAKDLATFQIALSESIAIAEAIKDAQVAGFTPIETAVILVASLSAIAKVISQSRQVLNSVPVPQFATGTKDFREGGIAEVGERGRERVILPAHTMVLAHSPTVKYKAELDAMQDGTYENYIQKKIQAEAPEAYDDWLLRKVGKQGTRQSIDNTDRIVGAINGTTAKAKRSNHRLHARI